MAPALGLYLGELFFDGYNAKQRKEMVNDRRLAAAKASKAAANKYVPPSVSAAAAAAAESSSVTVSVSAPTSATEEGIHTVLLTTLHCAALCMYVNLQLVVLYSSAVRCAPSSLVSGFYLYSARLCVLLSLLHIPGVFTGKDGDSAEGKEESAAKRVKINPPGENPAVTAADTVAPTAPPPAPAPAATSASKEEDGQEGQCHEEIAWSSEPDTLRATTDFRENVIHKHIFAQVFAHVYCFFSIRIRFFGIKGAAEFEKLDVLALFLTFFSYI